MLFVFSRIQIVFVLVNLCVVCSCFAFEFVCCLFKLLYAQCIFATLVSFG